MSWGGIQTHICQSIFRSCQNLLEHERKKKKKEKKKRKQAKKKNKHKRTRRQGVKNSFFISKWDKPSIITLPKEAKGIKDKKRKSN